MTLAAAHASSLTQLDLTERTHHQGTNAFPSVKHASRKARRTIIFKKTHDARSVSCTLSCLAYEADQPERLTELISIELKPSHHSNSLLDVQIYCHHH